MKARTILCFRSEALPHLEEARALEGECKHRVGCVRPLDVKWKFARSHGLGDDKASTELFAPKARIHNSE